jgi:hypothetical protein
MFFNLIPPVFKLNDQGHKKFRAALRFYESDTRMGAHLQ